MRCLRSLRVSVYASATLLLCSTLNLPAQNSSITSTPTADPAFGTRSNTIDNIDLNTLNAHISIPLVTLPGRGGSGDVTYSLTYDTASFNYQWFLNQVRFSPNPTGPYLGWGSITTPTTMGRLALVYGWDCGSAGGSAEEYVFIDALGATHNLNASTECYPIDNGVYHSVAGDGSGYSFTFSQNSTMVKDMSGNVVESCTGSSNCFWATGSGDWLLDSLAMHYYSEYYGTLKCFNYTIGINIYNENCTEQGVVDSGGPILQDANGNQIIESSSVSADYSSATSTVTSTSGASMTFAYSMATPLRSTVSYVDSSGSTQSVSINYGNFTVQTNFCNGNCTEISPSSVTLPVSVVYPDGTSYQFGYEPTPGVSGSVTGRLATITMPTGGQIAYHYGNAQDSLGLFVGTNYCDPVDLFDPQYTTGFTRTTPDGTTTYRRSAGLTPSSPYLCAAQTTITSATGDQTVISFAGGGDGNELEIARTVYQGQSTSNTPLVATTQQYIYGNQTPAGSNPLIGPGTIAEIDKTTTLPNGLSSLVVTKYHVGTYPSEVDEYDYSASSPTRETVTTYAGLGSILNKPSDVKVTDGTGTNVLAETTYSYDDTAVVASGSSPAPVSVTGSRGNLTTTTKLNPTGVASQVKMSNYDTGMVHAATDANTNANMAGSVTTYSYDASGAFPSSITVAGTSATSQAMSYVYEDNTGLLTSVTDANSRQTSYTYDSVGRLLTVQYPTILSGTHGGTQYCYSFPGAGGVATTSPSGCTNSVANSVQTTVTASPGPAIVTNTSYDLMGRAIHTVQPDGSVVDTGYDVDGRVQYVSNPHTSTAASTDGYTAFTYDALNRKLLQCQPDNGTGSTACGVGNSYLSWSYDGTVTTATIGDPMTTRDEDGNQTLQITDGLGRLVRVVEPGTLTTNYTYDVLGNLIKVAQLGNSGSDTARNRTFTYDGLSRLICASNPENSSSSCPASATSTMPTSGLTRYSYDPNGNLVSKSAPLVNQSSGAQTTTYGYDGLNRLLSKTYSAGAPSSCYQYDQSTIALTGGNLIGRLTNSWTQTSTTCPTAPPATGALSRHSILAYDAMGRMTNEQQCTLASCTGTVYATSYSYDLAGNLLTHSSGLPSGAGSFVFTNAYDASGRLASVTSSNTLYPPTLFAVPATPTPAGCNASASSTPGYSPAGGLMNATFGVGLQLTRSYDSRLRPNCEMDIGNSVLNPTPGTATITITPH